MYKSHRIAVVVPAYNEETQIRNVIVTMPEIVDDIVIVNDASKDGTGDVVRSLVSAHPRVRLIDHEVNQGVGAP